MALHSINGVELWIEEEGSGPPLVFVHEFGGDVRVWRPQIDHFRDRFRCVAYNARGYAPSTVPEDENEYGVGIALADLRGVLDALNIEKAHLVGLSMGAYNILRFALEYPERVLSITVASGGSGSFPPTRSHFIAETKTTATMMLNSPTLAQSTLYDGPTRVQLKRKRPAEWQEFSTNFAKFSAKGAGNTLRRVQAERASLYDFEDPLAASNVPTLLMIGDEDELVIEVNVFLKRTMPLAGLLVVPKSGHLINLEDPDIFNRALDEFLAAVDSQNWPARPAGSANQNAYTQSPEQREKK